MRIEPPAPEPCPRVYLGQAGGAGPGQVGVGGPGPDGISNAGG